MSDINDIHRFVVNWNFDTDSAAQLVYHRKHVAGTSVADSVVLSAELANLQAAWLDIDNIISTSLVGTILEHLKWDFANHRWDGVASTALTALDGLGAGEYMPHGVSMLGKVITVALRRQMRKFIPGVLEGAVADGYITSGNLVLFASFLDKFDTALTSGGSTIQLCTFNTDDLSPLYETASISAGSVVAEGLIGYQRRRKPGVGLT